MEGQSVKRHVLGRGLEAVADIFADLTFRDRVLPNEAFTRYAETVELPG